MKCELCGRESDNDSLFEKHHLVPGKYRRKKMNRRDDVIIVCATGCGDQIHLMFDNNELRNDLDSLEALRAAMQSFIHWVSKRPLDGKVNMKRKKRKL